MSLEPEVILGDGFEPKGACRRTTIIHNIQDVEPAVDGPNSESVILLQPPLNMLAELLLTPQGFLLVAEPYDPDDPVSIIIDPPIYIPLGLSLVIPMPSIADPIVSVVGGTLVDGGTMTLTFDMRQPESGHPSAYNPADAYGDFPSISVATQIL